MKTVFAVAAILASATVGAQEHEQAQVKFGDETVTLKIVSAQRIADEHGWVDPIVSETDPETKARGMLWRGYGDSLASLAQLREQAGDPVGAYAHLYLLDQLTRFNAKVHDERVARNGREQGWNAAKEAAWHAVQMPHYASIHKELARLGSKLSPSQREAAIRQAAQIYNSNPNCCMEM